MSLLRKVLWFVLFVVFINRSSCLFSEEMEDTLSSFLDNYSIDLSFVPSEGVGGICPVLVIRNTSGKDFVSVDENTILYNMDIYIKTYYYPEDREGNVTLRDSTYFGSTVFPPMPRGNQKFIQIKEQHVFDLCGHMEMFKRIMQPDIVNAVVVKQRKIDYLKIKFAFSNLFRLPVDTEGAEVTIYSNEYRMEGKMLDRLITSLTAKTKP